MKKRKQNTEQEDLEEIEPLPGSGLSKIPSWILITFVKYWAAAAAVFFIIIGGSDIGFDFTSVYDDRVLYIRDNLVIIILIALFSALFMNYVTKAATRMMYSRRNNTYRFTIYNQKGLSAFFVYFAYSFLMSFILYFVVEFLSAHGLVFDPFGTSGGVGIEPFSYALCYIVIDAVFVFIKNMVLKIIQRVVYSKQMKDNRPIIVEKIAETAE